MHQLFVDTVLTAAAVEGDNSGPNTLLTLLVLPVVVAGLTAIVTLLITKAGEATGRRRDHYANAVKTLVAWSEFPYRVRRRTDDDHATLTCLANLAHDLQEQLACHQAWIAADHPRLAQSYAKALAKVSTAVGPAVAEAWNTPPVDSATRMNLGPWGPGASCRVAVTELSGEISARFGLRRLRRRMLTTPPAGTLTGTLTAIKPCRRRRVGTSHPYEAAPAEGEVTLTEAFTEPPAPGTTIAVQTPEDGTRRRTGDCL